MCKFQRQSIECTFLLKGRISGNIDDKPVELQQGDYVVIQPGVKNNFPTAILEDATGLTVKAPSIEGDKREC